MPIIDLDDAKAHLNVTTNDDNAVILNKIDAAEAWISKFIGTALDDAALYPAGPPEPLKEAVRQLVGHLYENREASIVGVSVEAMPFGLMDLIAPYRVWSF